MIRKIHPAIFAILIFLVFFIVASAWAQDKVVVIPLMEEAKLDPFAPVAVESPPNSAYTIGTDIVTDKITGLVWQKLDDNTTRTWYDAWDYCTDNEDGLPGTGWRLPTVDELMSIVDYGTSNPAISGTAFPGTNSASYWSAATRATHNNFAWYVQFINGTVDNYYKSASTYVRCVRGLPNRESLFKNNGNGTVTDLATGLTWQREDDNVLRSNDGPAAAYCQGLGLAGGGWRLPTVKELQSIVDDRVYDPAIDTDAFPGTSAMYWPATTVADVSGNVWGVEFFDGSVTVRATTHFNYVRCVR